MKGARVGVLAALLAAPALAEAPLTSPRPEARAEEAPPPPAPLAAGRPQARAPRGEPGAAPLMLAARPDGEPVVASAAPEPPAAYAPDGAPRFVPDEGVTLLAVAEAALPPPRPAALIARIEQARAEAARGQVCGNPLIQGEAEASFGSGGGCGIEDPVRVRSVDGVRLSSPALMDCTTAEALLTWVQGGARPALAGRGGGLARIDVIGDYACRPRNNQAGERLSEHGRGRAIDVGGLTLADGAQVVVLRDWPDPALRAMHAAACGPFATVLGPEANSLHRNHLHLDTARGRGPYCR